MPYPNEWSCRLVDPGQVKVVGSGKRKHDGKTYRIIFGIPKGGDGSVEQAYRYPKDTWSRDQARSHCQAHDGRFEASAEGSGRELTFNAAVHSIVTGAERNLATFYLMNTSMNRNRWGVTDRALEEALPALMGKSVGCCEGYDNSRHCNKPMNVGKWVATDKPDGYALGTMEVTDPQVWELVSSGKWGPVSVVIDSWRESCSLCGQDITADPWNHGHVKEKQAYIVVESFNFSRVDFIEDAAYPQAGLLKLGAEQVPCEGCVGIEARLELCAGYYVSQSTKDGDNGRMSQHTGFAKAPEDTPWDLNRADYTLEQLKRASAVVTGDGDTKGDCRLPHHKPDGTLVWNGVSTAGAALRGARGGVRLSPADAAKAKAHLTPHYHAFDKEAPWEAQGGQGPGSLKPEEKRKMSEQIEELKTQVTDLTAELEQVKTERDELKAEAEGEDPKIKELESKLKAIEYERHQERLDAALDARVKAGLTSDRAVEAERLKEFDDSVLTLLAEEAEKVSERLGSVKPEPKTRYSKDDKTAFEAAVDEMRETLGFEPRVREAET